MEFTHELKRCLVSALVGKAQHHEQADRIATLYGAINQCFTGVDARDGELVEQATVRLCGSVRDIFGSDMTAEVRNSVAMALSSHLSRSRRKYAAEPRQNAWNRIKSYLSGLAAGLAGTD